LSAWRPPGDIVKVEVSHLGGDVTRAYGSRITTWSICGWLDIVIDPYKLAYTRVEYSLEGSDICSNSCQGRVVLS
jgi:hypothetical protein